MTVIYRYTNNQLCLIITNTFLVLMIYCLLQLVGLRLDSNNLDTKKPLPWGCKTFLNKAACFASGRAYLYHGSMNFKQSVCNVSDLQLRTEEILTPLIFGIWVLPVLGFIGTVVGITEAIGGLEPLLNMQKHAGTLNLGQTMGNVLNGLKYAFDTTLIGLVLVIPTMVCFYYLKIRIDRFTLIFTSSGI
jgi:hypothetical protein